MTKTTRNVQDLFKTYVANGKDGNRKSEGDEQFRKKNAIDKIDNSDPKLGPKDDQFVAKNKTYDRSKERYGYNAGTEDGTYMESKEWYDKDGRVHPNGCFDAGGHYHAERDADNIDSRRSSKKDEALLKEGKTVRIHYPGHPAHNKEAKVFYEHQDGRVNAQLTSGFGKEATVTNYTLHPHQFKMVSEETLDETNNGIVRAMGKSRTLRKYVPGLGKNEAGERALDNDYHANLMKQSDPKQNPDHEKDSFSGKAARRASDRYLKIATNEDAEQIDELSKATLKSYVNKKVNRIIDKDEKSNPYGIDREMVSSPERIKDFKDLNRARGKLNNEEVEDLEEGYGIKHNGFANWKQGVENWADSHTTNGARGVVYHTETVGVPGNTWSQTTAQHPQYDYRIGHFNHTGKGKSEEGYGRHQEYHDGLYEEAEEINELSIDTVDRYAYAADKQGLQAHNNAKVQGRDGSSWKNLYKKRVKGLTMAGKKLNGSAKVPASDEADQQMMAEKHLTPAELAKREDIAKGIAKSNPTMPMSTKMAIATAKAKEVAEDTKFVSNPVVQSLPSNYKAAGPLAAGQPAAPVKRVAATQDVANDNAANAARSAPRPTSTPRATPTANPAQVTPTPRAAALSINPTKALAAQASNGYAAQAGLAARSINPSRSTADNMLSAQAAKGYAVQAKQAAALAGYRPANTQTPSPSYPVRNVMPIAKKATPKPGYISGSIGGLVNALHEEVESNSMTAAITHLSNTSRKDV